MTPRRGILLGLGFSLEALKAAGLTDEQLDAPAQPTVHPDSYAESGIYDIDFQTTRQMIDVTCHNDVTPQYVQGMQRATVTFRVSLLAMHAWHEALMSGEPVQFDERVGGVRLSCRLRVTDMREEAPIDGTMTVFVRAQVVGAPEIVQVVEVAPPVPVPVPVRKDRGRRGVKLGGDRLLID